MLETPEPTISGREPLSEDEALKQTRTLMDMRETVQAMGIAAIADGSVKNFKQYYYEAFEKNLLVEAWAPLIQNTGFTVSPYLKILYAEAVTGGPKVALMLNNRKFRLENEKLRRELKAERQKNGKEPVKELRRDSQRQWQIDKNGYFVYTTANRYLKDGERVTKPDLSIDGTYEMLCKHNGQDVINQIFNL